MSSDREPLIDGLHGKSNKKPIIAGLGGSNSKSVSDGRNNTGTQSEKTEAINVKAFLKLIKYAEHKRDDDEIYYLLFGGKEKFTDTSAHPDRKMKAWGTTSTAAGAYQILSGTWKDAKKNGIVSDFTPASQDKIAIWKLKTRGALKYVKAGDVENSIAKLRNEWSSLPGASQSHMTMSEAKRLFEKYVKEYRN